MNLNKEKERPNYRYYSFEDGNFSFWQGEVDGKTVVIRVREDCDPVKRWVKKGLPRVSPYMNIMKKW